MMVSAATFEQAVIAVERCKDLAQDHLSVCQAFSRSHGYIIKHLYLPTANEPLKQRGLDRIYDSFRKVLIKSRVNCVSRRELCQKFIRKVSAIKESDYHTLYHIERNFRANFGSLLEAAKQLEAQYSGCMDNLKKQMIHEDCQAFERIIQESWNLSD